MTGKKVRKPTAAKLRAFLKAVDAKIAESGRMVMMVGSDEERGIPSFAYTIGLSGRALPELIVFGLGPVGVSVLNDLAERLLDGEALPRNQRMNDVFKGVDAVLQEVPAGVAQHFLRVAFDKYGSGVQTLQLIWPDAAGKLPWEEGHDMSLRKSQPLLAAQ